MFTDSEIIERLAKELGKRDRDDLCRLVSTMTFGEAYSKLHGYNLNTESYEYFDVNYKSISATIYMTPNGNCEVHGSIDVWLADISGPVLTNYTIK